MYQNEKIHAPEDQHRCFWKIFGQFLFQKCGKIVFILKTTTLINQHIIITPEFSIRNSCSKLMVFPLIHSITHVRLETPHTVSHSQSPHSVFTAVMHVCICMFYVCMCDAFEKLPWFMLYAVVIGHIQQCRITAFWLYSFYLNENVYATERWWGSRRGRGKVWTWAWCIVAVVAYLYSSLVNVCECEDH